MRRAAARQDPSVAYWEARARRFASDGQGLRAVCSYGMPSFYNAAIHLSQRLALGPWLRPKPGTAVLDVGCGVGRWSRLLASRGAHVTGIDLSRVMVAEACRRAERDHLDDRCQFQAADLADLDLGRRFPLILGVTVLQHILDEERLLSAVDRLEAHLEPDGRIVLLEAAPSRASARCDSAFFTARTAADYRSIFRRAGLQVEAESGVDPAPFKILFLPHYARLPPPLAQLGLALVTAASLPLDLVLGRRLPRLSWHKVFILRRA